MRTALQKHALSYLRNKAESDKSSALASFELLLNAAVGIGDHSTGDYYKELETALSTLVDAEDRIDILHTYFPEQTE